MTSKGFKQRACRRLDGIPAEAVQLIYWMQPYHTHKVEHQHAFKVLAALDTLWNISKHRSLLVVAAATRPHFVAGGRSDEDADRVGFRMRARRHTSEIWLPITEPPEHYDAHFKVRVSLAEPGGFANDWPKWVEGWELDGLAGTIHRVVRYEIAPQFNPYVR